MTKKRNLLLVSLLLVFGLGVAAPSLFAQVVFTASNNTNNYIRNEGDAEAVGTVALTVSTGGTIVAGSTLSITYNAIVASNTAGYAVAVGCSATWPSGCPSFAAATITVTTLTTPASSVVILSFPSNVTAIPVGAGIKVAARVVAQGLPYASQVNATVTSFVPAQYILTNSISIFSYTPQPFLVGTVGPKSATTGAVFTLAQVLTCIGATAPASDTFTISLTEDWANALTSKADETLLETDTNSLAPTNGSNILITLSGIPTGVKVVASPPAVCGQTKATTPTGTVACPGGKLTISNATASSVSGGVQSFFYMVLTTNTLVIENAAFPFTFSSPGPLPVGLGPTTYGVSLTDLSPSVPDDMPIFTLPETSTGPVISFNDCVTNLMFPYVNTINMAGYSAADTHWGTGIQIANTTKDPFGLSLSTKAGSAVPQTGSCTFYFYPSSGSGAIAWTTPKAIPSGGSYSFDVGSVAPAFYGQYGYAIAICSFQNANGLVTIWDNYGIGDPTVGLTYLPYVIPNPSLYHRNPAGEELGEFAITPHP